MATIPGEGATHCENTAEQGWAQTAPVYVSHCLRSKSMRGRRYAGSSSHSPTCLLLDDSPVLKAVDVLLQPGAQLHVAHIVQKDIDDGSRPAAHFRGRQEFTELE